MKKGLKITSAILGSLVGIYAILALFPRPDNYTPESPSIWIKCILWALTIM